jgi:hypothetical protein
MTQTRTVAPTPLALFVNRRLAELKIKQSEFCRLNDFDQGLLSKIQNSVVSNLSLESALRLSAGLAVSPRHILDLLDRMDLHELVFRAYEPEFIEMVEERVKSLSRRASGVNRGAALLRPKAHGKNQ